MRRDSEVEQQVLRSLQLDSAISSREICVESRDGLVTLSGTVPSYHESSAIYFATRRAPGVCDVINLINVKDNGLLIPASPKDRLGPLPLPWFAFTGVVRRSQAQTHEKRKQQSR